MTFLTHPVAWLLPALMLVLAGTQLALPPRMRPGLWFSVTVPSDFPVSERGRRILRTYRAGVLLGSGGALVLAFGVLRNGGRWMAFAGMLLQQVSGLLAFLAARRQVLPHAVPADTTREAVLLAREEGLPGGVGLQLGPFAVLAVTALWLHSHL
ncbi:MAG: hypothetical protein ACXU86_04880, partial [Archangium sp.]